MPYKGSRITEDMDSFDIQVDSESFEDAWYKGIPGHYRCHVSTSGLSAVEIVEWRDKIENELGKLRNRD